MSRLCADNRAYVVFYLHCLFVKHRVSHQVLLTGYLEDGIYKVSKPVSPSFQLLHSALDVDLWHSRLGHPAKDIVSTVFSLCNPSVSRSSKLSFCKACQQAKSHRLPFPVSVSRASKPFELIHSDL